MDKNGPWVLLGVFPTCVARCGGLLDEGEGRPAVLSREFRRTDHVNCMKQETFLSGVRIPFNNPPLDTSLLLCVFGLE